ncbi:Ribonuclease P protein component [Polaromonas sp. CG9_12]|nr:Ribonuclease P protein component [Polaromonas sp. CG9_12]
MQRLKTRAQFQAVLAGTIIARTPHFALHRNQLDTKIPVPETAEPVEPGRLFRHQDMWIGAMVPKRWAKRAVTRNAIKRQIYTVCADFSQLYPQAAFVVRLRSGFASAQFVSAVSDQLRQAVRHEIQTLMQAGAKEA